jgi:hypothetical protein
LAGRRNHMLAVRGRECRGALLQPEGCMYLRNEAGSRYLAFAEGFWASD